MGSFASINEAPSPTKMNGLTKVSAPLTGLANLRRGTVRNSTTLDLGSLSPLKLKLTQETPLTTIPSVARKASKRPTL